MSLSGGGSRVCSSFGSALHKARGADSPHNSNTGRGGSTVKLDTSANQKVAQETLRSVPQPKRYCDSAGEVKIEWEYSEFVWWSDFLRELPKSYVKLFDLLGVDKDDYFWDYRGFYCYHHAVQNSSCPVKSIYVPVVKCGKYHPYASVKHQRRASIRALDRLEFLQQECRKRHVKFDYMIAIDLTLPKAVSLKWNDRGIQRRIHRAVQGFLSELHGELFPKKNSKFGVISNYHYNASRSPLTPHTNIHLTIPNVCYNHKTDMFHRFQARIDKDLIKKVWKKCLVENDLWFGVKKDADPVIWTEYFKFANKERLLHRLSYCSRKPIVDLFRELDISDLNMFDEGFALFLLDYTPRRINLGFLTNLKRFGYSRKSTPLRCPICGQEMEPELNKRGDKRFHPRPPPNAPHLFRDRKTEWRETVNLVRR